MSNLENLKIRKNDGRMEDFDRNKVIRGVVVSGATAEQAEDIATQVEEWAKSMPGGVVKSADVRTKVLSILHSVNPTAATAFETYRKSPQ